MKNMKKGVSAVVATVLIILITVAAVTIIWSAVIPMIKDNLIGSDNCMKAQSEVSIGTGGYTCIKSNTNGNISLQIVRGPSAFDLDSVDVIIHVGGNSFTKSVNGTNLPGVYQSKVVYLNDTAYINATKVEIAPVLKIGATTKNCGSVGGVDLVLCAQ